MSVCKFGNWFRDRSLMISDILYIIGKGICIALKWFFLKTKKVDTPRQNTELFLLFICQAKTALPGRLWAPLPQLKGKSIIWDILQEKDQKKATFLVEKKKEG